MRVISGDRKGQKLLNPKSFAPSRPTEDRVKESVFNTIQPIEKDSKVIDLFSATGQIGIEFLSRGSSFVYFSENNRDNIELLKLNLEKTRYTDNSKVLIGDYARNLASIRDKVDYVYLDPPYDSDYVKISIKLLLKYDLLNDNALVIVETEKDIDFSIYKELELVKEKDFRTKTIYYLRKY